MREVIARSNIQPILTEGRSIIETDTQEIIQKILDEYTSGIQITQVQTQKADPPDQGLLMHLEMYRLQELIWKDLKMKPKHVMSSQELEGKHKILQAAEAYKKEVVAKARGEASRFWQFIMNTRMLNQ